MEKLFKRPQQRALFEALDEKDSELSSMYFGSLIVLENDKNPERLIHAAHSIRELMEKIPRFINIKIKAQKESLKSKVFELHNSWKVVQKKSGGCSDGKWNGTIDSSLKKYLGQQQAFFSWHETHNPRRKAEIAITIRKLDGSPYTMPAPLEKLNVDMWGEIRDFFINVSHHRNNSTLEQLEGWVYELEKFLLDRLRPRTFEDIDSIDKIIEDGESDAE